MGEAFAGKTLDRKAMVWGAIAQSFPDIDFVAASWLNTPSALLAHLALHIQFCSQLLLH
jgi:inner membrane protein